LQIFVNTSNGKVGESPVEEQLENRSELLRVEGLSKSFTGFKALSDVSFGLRERAVLGIIGPNGAGKTTLLECLAGLLPANSGKVFWKGEPLPSSGRKDVMFYLPENIAPYGEQPTFRLTGLFRDVYGLSRERERDVLLCLGIEKVLTRRIGELSRGYRRRVLLALAMLAPRPLLLLDEPFDGLDPRQTIEVANLLREEAASGRTLLLSIHQLADAARICSRFLLLVEGKVVGCGTVEELRGQAGIQSENLEAIFFALT
jgi:ABC-2 type transport system ATP-binding protein